MEHNYKKSLAESENIIPDSFYKRIFGSNSVVTTIPTNSPLQFQGADKQITLPDGKVFYCEEKIRGKDYGDLLLETHSCVERQTKGWIEKDCISEWLVYFCKDSKRVFILKMKEIQDEYNRRKGVWLDRHRVLTADNGFYTSRNVAVPWTDVESRVFPCSI